MALQPPSAMLCVDWPVNKEPPKEVLVAELRSGDVLQVHTRALRVATAPHSHSTLYSRQSQPVPFAAAPRMVQVPDLALNIYERLHVREALLRPHRDSSEAQT
eukprot:1098011-Pleurochrysis_carterae.AAC.1